MKYDKWININEEKEKEQPIIKSKAQTFITLVDGTVVKLTNEYCSLFALLNKPTLAFIELEMESYEVFSGLRIVFKTEKIIINKNHIISATAIKNQYNEQISVPQRPQDCKENLRNNTRCT